MARYARLWVLLVSVIAAIGSLAPLSAMAIFPEDPSPPHPHNIRVVQGLELGHFLVNKFGSNSAVSDTAEVIWSAGGVYTGFLLTAANIEVVSDSANDDEDGGGTNLGGHTVTVLGLDENFVPITETIELNGTGASLALTETSWIRVWRAYVDDGGTYTTSAATGSNIGTIIIRVASGGAKMAQIEPETGQTEQTPYTVPADTTCTLESFFVEVSVTANKTASVAFWQRQNADDVDSPFTARRLIEKFEDLNGEFSEDVDSTISFPEKTDLWWTGIRTGSADALIDVDYELHCFPN